MRDRLTVTPTGARRRKARFAARLARSEGGATAVEFGIIGIPFFMLLFGILELAMIFVLSTSLDNATQTVARRIRTGEAQAGAVAEKRINSKLEMRDEVCKKLVWLSFSDCQTALSVDVQNFTTFNDVTTADPQIKDGAIDPEYVKWLPGGPGSIVRVRAYYEWPLLSPALSKAVMKLPGNKALVISTLAFRNEPYGP